MVSRSTECYPTLASSLRPGWLPIGNVFDDVDETGADLAFAIIALGGGRLDRSISVSRRRSQLGGFGIL